MSPVVVEGVLVGRAVWFWCSPKASRRLPRHELRSQTVVIDNVESWGLAAFGTLFSDEGESERERDPLHREERTKAAPIIHRCTHLRPPANGGQARQRALFPLSFGVWASRGFCCSCLRTRNERSIGLRRGPVSSRAIATQLCRFRLPFGFGDARSSGMTVATQEVLVSTSRKPVAALWAYLHLVHGVNRGLTAVDGG